MRLELFTVGKIACYSPPSLRVPMYGVTYCFMGVSCLKFLLSFISTRY